MKREGREMAHWLYILCAMGGSAGFAAACRYIPRAFLMLVGGLTASPQRSKQCERMIILSRGDAKELLERLAHSSETDKELAVSADEPATTLSDATYST
jgi:hypothetical protein